MSKIEKWVRKGVNEQLTEHLLTELPFLTKNQIVFLIRRGLTTKSKIQHFLDFSEKDVTSVKKMKDFDKFFDRIKLAISRQEQITIYGDYDVDGITGTSILVRFLRLLDLNPHYFINSRFEEGFGINVEGVNNLLDRYPDTQLIITVDNGISGVEGVEEASKRGIDVLITDHHEPRGDGVLPSAIAVIDAKRNDETAEFRDLCGAAVAYKIGKAILQELKPEALSEYHKCLSLVALATICDVVPLVDENHYFAKIGLQLVNDGCYPVWEVLKKITDARGVITETTFGYTYGPMLNALGRLDGRPLLAVELMISDDLQAINEIALDLKEFNIRRKELSLTQQKEVEYFIMSNRLEKNETMVIYGDYHEGIAGILAGRVKERYYKPTIVLCKTEDKNIYKGSARSVNGFNMKEALEKCSHLLVKAGGHAMAAGLTIEKKNIREFCVAFENIAKSASFYAKIEPVLELDYIFEGSKLNFADIKSFEEFAPFGQQFGEPIIGLIGRVKQSPVLLKERHFKLVVEGPESDLPINILAWNCSPTLVGDFTSVPLIKAIGKLEPNRSYNNQLQYNFILKDERIRPYELL